MKKHLFLSLLTALSCLAFVSCGDSDENDEGVVENEMLEKLSSNQFLYDGKVYDFSCIVSVNPAHGEYPGGHFATLTATNYHGRFDIGTPMVNVPVDLAHPTKTIGDSQLSFALMNETETTNYMSLDAYPDGLYSIINDVEMENESCFKEGSFLATHSDKEFTITMWGTLTNNDTFAMKIVVPEEDVEYWTVN